MLMFMFKNESQIFNLLITPLFNFHLVKLKNCKKNSLDLAWPLVVHFKTKEKINSHYILRHEVDT